MASFSSPSFLEIRPATTVGVRGSSRFIRNDQRIRNPLVWNPRIYDQSAAHGIYIENPRISAGGHAFVRFNEF